MVVGSTLAPRVLLRVQWGIFMARVAKLVIIPPASTRLCGRPTHVLDGQGSRWRVTRICCEPAVSQMVLVPKGDRTQPGEYACSGRLNRRPVGVPPPCDKIDVEFSRSWEGTLLFIRPAAIEDVPLLRTMICELAGFEHELDSVSITEESLARDGFGSEPKFRALIADWDGEVAGYAVFFDFYSTWRGRQLFLEDLFVRPKFRGKGIGKGLLSYVANIACSESFSAMRWEVLSWNQHAIDLYRSLGAEFLEDWRLMLLRDDALQQLGKAL